MTETPFAPLIQTQADLQSAWRHLMGPWAFEGHSIWLMFIVEDRPIPQLTEITETHGLPTADTLEGFTTVLRGLAEDVLDDTRIAFLRTRPGGAMVTPADRRWAEGLYGAAHAAGIPCEVVHLGTHRAIRALPRDELGVADSA